MTEQELAFEQLETMVSRINRLRKEAVEHAEKHDLILSNMTGSTPLIVVCAKDYDSIPDKDEWLSSSVCW